MQTTPAAQARRTSREGRIWKAAYRDGRASLNVSERLRKLAAASN
jgi:hypothetical protein